MLTLLTIARVDADRSNEIDEAELQEFEETAQRLIRDTCDALQTSAVVGMHSRGLLQPGTTARIYICTALHLIASSL